MMQFLCSTANWGLSVLALLVVMHLLMGSYVWRMLCSLIFCLIIFCVKSWENFAYCAYCIYIQIKQTTSRSRFVFSATKAINSLKTYQQDVNSSDSNLNLPFQNNQSLAFQSKAENVNQFIVTSTCCDQPYEWKHVSGMCWSLQNSKQIGFVIDERAGKFWGMRIIYSRISPNQPETCLCEYFHFLRSCITFFGLSMWKGSSCYYWKCWAPFFYYW